MLVPLIRTVHCAAKCHPCPRCGNRNCTDVRHRDVDEIAVERVFTAVRETLARR